MVSISVPESGQLPTVDTHVRYVPVEAETWKCKAMQDHLPDRHCSYHRGDAVTRRKRTDNDIAFLFIHTGGETDFTLSGMMRISMLGSVSNTDLSVRD